VILYKKVPAMAMLRLPTRASNGRANLHQGGIGAGVALDTGVTTRAVMNNHLTDRHPDTGVSLVGFRVPHWPEILEMARRVAAAVDLGYLGVDIVVDRDQGPLLLEANARPGLAIQIANGQGLLARLEAIDRDLARGAAAAAAGLDVTSFSTPPEYGEGRANSQAP
jgi:alpha-L-glutamate ligase-like protein